MKRAEGLTFAGIIGIAAAMVLFAPGWCSVKWAQLSSAWTNEIFTDHLYNPEFWIIVSIALLLERIIPATPRQHASRIYRSQDLAWFFYEAAFSAIIFGTYVNWLRYEYQQHANFLTITMLNSQPHWIRFAIGVLLLDFLVWFQHVLHHKIPFLWRFHALHHSQRELNFFTDYRYHIFEYVIRNTITVIPLLILRVDTPVIVAFAIFKRWHTRFYHANIKTNLGPLRYLVVTPQSHRIHHSIEERHRDKNFGAIFSFWDYILGTQYHAYNEYPETGIADQEFPLERSNSLLSIVVTPFRQLLYPLLPKSFYGLPPNSSEGELEKV